MNRSNESTGRRKGTGNIIPSTRNGTWDTNELYDANLNTCNDPINTIYTNSRFNEGEVEQTNRVVPNTANISSHQPSQTSTAVEMSSDARYYYPTHDAAILQQQ